MHILVRFTKLTIKNFKVHSDIDFDFSSNRLVMITGPNGSGKSTIIDALLWALYDEDTKGISGDDIVRKRSGKNTEVIVYFEIGDDKYRVEAYRKHDIHKNNRYIFKNDDAKPICGEDSKETLKLIQNIIMPINIFKNCLLFSQFIKNTFIESTHSTQKDLLDQMLSLGVFDKYNDKIKDVVSKLEEIVRNINSELPKYHGKIELNEENIKSITDTLERRKSDYNSIQQTRRMKLTQITNDMKETKPDDSLIHKVGDNIQVLNSSLSVSNHDIETAYDLYRVELNGLEQEKSNLIRNIRNSVEQEHRPILESLSLDINNKKEELSKVNLKYNDKKTSLIAEYNDKKHAIIDRYFPQLSDLKDSISHIKSEMMQYSTRKDELTKKYNAIKDELDKINNNKTVDHTTCYVCGQIISSSAKEKYENRISDLIEQKDNLSVVLKGIVSDYGKCEKQLKERTEDITKLEQIMESDKLKLDQQHTSVLDKLEKAYNNKVMSINDDISKLNIQKVKDDIENIIKQRTISETKSIHDRIKKLSSDKDTRENKIRDDIIKLTKQLKDETSKLESLNESKKKYDELNTQKEVIKKQGISEKESMDSYQKECEERLEKINKDIKELENNISIRKIKLEGITRKIEILNFWKKAFSDTGIRAIILDEAIPILNKKALELSKMTSNIRVRFDSISQTKKGEQRNKFSISALNTLNLSSLPEFSAGEKRLTNIIVLLCLRHLLETMYSVKFNIMLMDEIMDSLDFTNSELVSDMIQELAENYCIVLISHTARDFIDASERISL